MSEENTETQDELPPAQSSDPTPSGPDRVFVRLAFWQTVLSVAGVFIAIIALYAALTESAAVREQTAASVWPFVQLSIDDYNRGDSAGFSMALTNVGVGPARMRAVSLVIDREPMRDWAHAVAQVGGDPSTPFGRNFITDRVLRPDEKVVMISTTHPELAVSFQAAIADPRNYITYCYCSIFDDCWLADSREDVQDPQRVEDCPIFGDAAFEN